MKLREFELHGIKINIHGEPDQDGHIIVLLFLDNEEVKSTKNRIPQGEVEDFCDRLQQSFTSVIQK